MTSVLHTWGSALTHHPHVHMIVPGGGLSPDGARGSPAARASSCRSGSSRGCSGACSWTGCRRCTAPASSPSSATWPDWPTPPPSPPGSRRCARPSGSSTPSPRSAGPRRCSPISAATPTGWRSRTAGSSAPMPRRVAFRWKDYRLKNRDRHKVMRLATGEFIRRFLLHVLPDGFHRIRHYGLLAGAARKATLARIRDLLGAAAPAGNDATDTDVAAAAHPERTVPRLRRADADRRDLPARRTPDHPRPAAEGCRMMTGPSRSTNPAWTGYAVRKRTRPCLRLDLPPPGLDGTEHHRWMQTRLPEKAGALTSWSPAAPPSAPRRRHTSTTATPARFPHRRLRQIPPRLRSSEVCQRGPLPPVATVTQRPASKNLQGERTFAAAQPDRHQGAGSRTPPGFKHSASLRNSGHSGQ